MFRALSIIAAVAALAVSAAPVGSAHNLPFDDGAGPAAAGIIFDDGTGPHHHR